LRNPRKTGPYSRESFKPPEKNGPIRNRGRISLEGDQQGTNAGQSVVVGVGEGSIPRFSGGKKCAFFFGRQGEGNDR